MLRKDINNVNTQQEQLKDQIKGEEIAIANKELE